MTAAENKWVVRLDGTSLPDRNLIGGKAWSIARLRDLGLPTSPAVVATTAACRAYMETGELPDGLMDEIHDGINEIEQETGRFFGGTERPLLVAVRSGAPISMPGMMDTVLNLGMTDQAQAALAKESGDPEFATDTRRRFLELYDSIVLKSSGTDVPDTADGQLEGAVRAVFESWNARRAKRYRAHNNIPDDLGTAVTIQAMVFGNLDDQSGTGVLFSRNPLTGDPAPYGEYLPRAQGEDVVSGKVTPQPLSALLEAQPDMHAELLKATDVLERENADVQDIEFTVQQGKLYLLQSRAAKRSPAAAVRFAVDFVNEGRLDTKEALSRVSSEQIRTLLRPRLDDGEADRPDPVAVGEAACHGVGVGLVVLDADTAEAEAAKGHKVVLARPTTSPEDVHGMMVAEAIVTEQGGTTSHAAVVSRALGLPCVVGCGDGALTGLAGQTITVDGDTGRVFSAALPVKTHEEMKEPGISDLIPWAQELAPIQVCALGSVLPEGMNGSDIIDLDKMPGSEEPDQIEGLLAGAVAAQGGALNSDAGVSAAVRAGVKTIFVGQVLPALLAACAESKNIS
jgi:pyruvate, orthophosphate dikinase